MQGSPTTNRAAIRPDALRLDEPAEVERIGSWLRDALSRRLHRRGLVVAIGGIDSSVCAALSVRAFGPSRVFGLLMPERDSSSFSTERGRMLAQHLGIAHEVMDIALWALNHGVAAAELGAAIGCDAAKAERVYADIEAKRRAAAYLHAPAETLLEPSAL